MANLQTSHVVEEVDEVAASHLGAANSLGRGLWLDHSSRFAVHGEYAISGERITIYKRITVCDAAPLASGPVGAGPDLCRDRQADKDAHLPELIAFENLGELLDVSVNSDNWDPAHPCAHARPPTEHSHTFWADGTFKSYDENGKQVDDGPYTILDDHHFQIGDIPFTYDIINDGFGLQMKPVIPKNCTSRKCHLGLGWNFSVTFPGQTWMRVTSGPHVPPGSVPSA